MTHPMLATLEVELDFATETAQRAIAARLACRIHSLDPANQAALAVLERSRGGAGVRGDLPAIGPRRSGLGPLGRRSSPGALGVQGLAALARIT